MSLFRTILTVSFFTLLLAGLGGPLVLQAATAPARRQLGTGLRAVPLESTAVRHAATLPLGGQFGLAS